MKFSADLVIKAFDHIICRQFSSEGEVRSRAVMLSDDGPIDYILDWDDYAGKQSAVELLRQRMATLKIENYVVLGEAWLAPWPVAGDKIIAASKSDQRIEVAYFHICQGHHANWFCYRKIETCVLLTNQMRKLGPLQVEKDVAGYFGELGARTER